MSKKTSYINELENDIFGLVFNFAPIFGLYIGHKVITDSEKHFGDFNINALPDITFTMIWFTVSSLIYLNSITANSNFSLNDSNEYKWKFSIYNSAHFLFYSVLLILYIIIKFSSHEIFTITVENARLIKNCLIGYLGILIILRIFAINLKITVTNNHTNGKNQGGHGSFFSNTKIKT